MSVEERVASQCATWRRGDSPCRRCFPLAGQNREYMVKQLNDFKAGKRKSETMSPQVADLGQEEMAALAAYFSAQPAKQHVVSDEDRSRRPLHLSHSGTAGPACRPAPTATVLDGHGDSGAARLAARARYLLTQLKEFNQRTRTNDNQAMHMVASRLTEFRKPRRWPTICPQMP